MKPVAWKHGTTDTVQGAPIKDGVMAIADESYFDWPLLPEAPSSLDASITGNAAKLTWEVHGGGPTGIVVERRNDSKDAAPWEKVAQLGATASDYTDASYRSGMRSSYRVRAVNSGGTSAYSNIVRLPAQR